MSNPSRTYGGRSVHDRKAERRTRFLDAAAAGFARHGYEKTTLAQICAAAGLSKRQFYEEFDTLEDALIAVYDRVQEVNADGLQAALASLQPDSSLHETVSTVLRGHLEAMVSDPDSAAVIFVAVVGVSERMESRRRESRHMWAVLLESALPAVAGKHARIRGGPALASAALVGAINGLLHEWLLAANRGSVDELVDLLSPIVMALIDSPHKDRA